MKAATRPRPDRTLVVWSAVAALVAAWTAAAFLAPPVVESRPGLVASAIGSGHDSETARIQAHLAAVEARLRAHPPRGLTAAQLRARASHLDRLAAYRRAGVFPHNHDFEGRRVPYFVDAHGTRCAMAHLIESAGGADVVRLVASTANNARVVELAETPGIGDALAAWLDAAGLTIEEAQAIQPAYGYFPGQSGPDKITSDHAIVAGVAGTACLASTALNLFGPRSRTAGIVTPIIGAAAGATAVAVGAAHLDDGGESETLGAIEVGVGSVSLVAAGLRALGVIGRDDRPRETASRDGAAESSGPRLAIAPTARYPIGLRLAF
ncbi:MAG TPA: hypothetical protein VFT32_10880 [Candidatus Eisenbacteria bacterium]|nr:hypothetical protein [Candidatus Eisenbacteria bacterium]